MTPEARKCFVNAVCYIRKFDGQKPIVRRKASGQEWAVVYAGYMKQYQGQEFVKQLFPDDLRRRFEKNPEKLVAYYQENLEYLLPSQNGFAVDEEVKVLELSNRKVELLDRCVALLFQGEQAERALRILTRYTNERFTDARRWNSWLKANRDLLFFSDFGGFKFMVAREALIEPLHRGGPGHAAVEQAREPDARHPVVATAELSPSTADRGGRSVITIRVKIAPPWHIYAAQGSNGVGVATTLKLELPDAIIGGTV